MDWLRGGGKTKPFIDVFSLLVAHEKDVYFYSFPDSCKSDCCCPAAFTLLSLLDPGISVRSKLLPIPTVAVATDP